MAWGESEVRIDGMHPYQFAPIRKCHPPGRDLITHSKNPQSACRSLRTWRSPGNWDKSDSTRTVMKILRSLLPASWGWAWGGLRLMGWEQQPEGTSVWGCGNTYYSHKSSSLPGSLPLGNYAGGQRGLEDIRVTGSKSQTSSMPSFPPRGRISFHCEHLRTLCPLPP